MLLNCDGALRIVEVSLDLRELENPHQLVKLDVVETDAVRFTVHHLAQEFEFDPHFFSGSLGFDLDDSKLKGFRAVRE